MVDISKVFSKDSVVVTDIPRIYLPEMDEFYEVLVKHKDSNICIEWDTDVDGISSGYIAFDATKKVIPNANIHNYINESKVHGIKKPLIKYIEEHNIHLLIVVDAGSNDVEAIQYLNQIGVTVVVIDHHVVSRHYKHEKFILINSSFLEHCKNVSGAYITNDTYKRVFEKFGMKPLKIYDELAVISLVSDMCDRDSFNRNVLINYMTGKIHPSPLVNAIKKKYQKHTVKTAISLSSGLNAILRNLGSRETMKLVMNPTELNILLYNVNRIKAENDLITTQLLQDSRIFETNNIIMVIIKEHPDKKVIARNYLGILASKIADKKNKFCMVMCDKKVNFEEQDEDYVYCYSARDPFNRDILSCFDKSELEAHGHAPSFGGKLYEDFSLKIPRLDKAISETEIPKSKFKLIDCETFVEGMSILDKDILNISCWNSVCNMEDKIGVPFKVQGVISKQGKIKKVSYMGLNMMTFDMTLTEGDMTVCIPELHEKVELRLYKI